MRQVRSTEVATLVCASFIALVDIVTGYPR
jgi:hypothetical protein